MTQDTKASPATIQIHYIKSAMFRTVHADGAIGAPTPNGHVSLTLYSERLPIPKSQVFDVVDGQLGPEQMAERDVRRGVVREMEVNVVMRLDTAVGLRDWLNRNIEVIENALASGDAE